MSIETIQIPVFNDNYIYVLQDHDSGRFAVVDPALAGPVIAVLEKKGAQLDLILNTHHHSDHVGGNLELKRHYGCKVVGPSADHCRIPGIDIRVGDGDEIALGSSIARVFDTPGHTKGHIVYFFQDDQALFCGDTLFSAGCGRLFEGTPEQMWESLKKLRTLPDSTAVYCAHEYTQANIQFALTVQPDLPELLAYAEEVRQRREVGLPSIPANLGREKLYNPFLRADKPELGLAVQKQSPVDVFEEIRRRKDHF